MNTAVACHSSGLGRFFPHITPSLYSPADRPGESPGSAILKLADHGISRWQLWTGRGLDPAGQLGRALRLHRSLLDDELNGRWQRADFYWREILRSLRRMQTEKGLWDELNAQFGFSDTPESEDSLRSRVVVELLIDTNRALFNGCLKNSDLPELGDRSDRYAANIRELLPLAGIGETERLLILEPLADTLIHAHQDRGELQTAIEICEDLTRDFPEYSKYQDLWVELVTQRAFTELHDEGASGVNLADARRLRQASDTLDRMRKTFPYNPRIYESIGLLSQVRSVKLANGGDLSEALLAIEESLAYSPGSVQALEIRRQLRESMQALQEQMAGLEADLAKQPGSTLNAEGERLRAQARDGSKSADRFAESQRAARLLEEGQQAQAVRLWQSIRLGGGDREIAARAMSLYQALPRVFAENPEDAEAIKAGVDKIAAEVPELDASMRESLERYLRRHLFEEDAAGDEEAPSQAADLPALEPHSGSEVPSREPTGIWLLSKEALGAKTIAVSAVALLAISTAAAGWDAYERNRRDQAYVAMLDAARAEREKGVLDAADEFLSAAGFRTDTRHDQVLRFREWARTAANRSRTDPVYEALIDAVRTQDVEEVQALAERFQALAADTPNDPRLSHAEQLGAQSRMVTDRLERDRAYERLREALEQQDIQAVIAAAESFVSAGQGLGDDPRADQVRMVRGQTRELPNRWVRDAAYRDLLAGLEAEDPESVISAAEAFLSAPPVQTADERQDEVVDAFSTAVVSWFIDVGNPDEPAVKQRLKSYRDLVADAGKEG